MSREDYIFQYIITYDKDPSFSDEEFCKEYIDNKHLNEKNNIIEHSIDDFIFEEKYEISILQKIKNTKYNKIEMNYISIEDIEDELNNWVKILDDFYKLPSAIDTETYIRTIYQHLDGKIKNNYLDVINKILDSVILYNKEINNNELRYKSPSLNSLIQTFRYVPFFSSKTDLEFYVDRDTGYFGFLRPLKYKKKGTLNVLIKDNYELIYSYVRKGNGISKFSGRGHLGKKPNNSNGILAILNMTDW